MLKRIAFLVLIVLATVTGQTYRVDHPRLPGPHGATHYDGRPWLQAFSETPSALARWTGYANSWDPVNHRDLRGPRATAVVFLATGDSQYAAKIRTWLAAFPGGTVPSNWTNSTALMVASMFYDWLYAEWNPLEREQWKSKILTYCDTWKAEFENGGYTYYNSVAFARAGCALSWGMASIWPDVATDLQACKLMAYSWTISEDRLMPALNQQLEGGGWPEGWGYWGDGTCRTVWPLLYLREYTLGEDPFNTLSWPRDTLRMADYLVQPDGTPVQVGDENTNILNLRSATGWGSFRGFPSVAVAVNDPVALAKLSASDRDPFEVLDWPWGRTGNPTLPTASQSTLPESHYFKGAATLSIKDGWGENGKTFTITCGPRFGSHRRMNDGHFEWYSSRGLLAGWGYPYTDFLSRGFVMHGKDSASHNCLEIYDPAESNGGKSIRLKVNSEDEPITWAVIPYDLTGGQKRVGSPYTSHPLTPAEYAARSEEFAGGRVLEFRDEGDYVVVRCDLTACYNSYPGAPAYAGRTNRVAWYERFFVFIRGQEETVVILDSAVLLKNSLEVRWLLHTVEPPVEHSPGVYRLQRHSAVTHQYGWDTSLLHRNSDGTYQYAATGHLQTIWPENAVTSLAGRPNWALGKIQSLDLGVGVPDNSERNFDEIGIKPYGNHQDWSVADYTKGPREHGLYRIAVTYPVPQTPTPAISMLNVLSGGASPAMVNRINEGLIQGVKINHNNQIWEVRFLPNLTVTVNRVW